MQLAHRPPAQPNDLREIVSMLIRALAALDDFVRDSKCEGCGTITANGIRIDSGQLCCPECIAFLRN